MHLAGFEESVLWEIDDKEFRYIAIRAKKKCKSNIIDEVLICKY